MNPSFINSLVPSKYSKQPFSMKLLFRDTPRAAKLETRVSDRKLCIVWICFYPLNKKKLFLKLALPKNQAKSLKAVCTKLCFYCACILWGFRFIKKTEELSATSVLSPCMWNINKPNIRSFTKLFIIIYILLMSLYVCRV